MTKLTFILLLFTLLSCTSSKKENEEAKNESIQSTTSIKRNAYKISSTKDSIVLVGTDPFYDGVQIFREKKKILDHTEKYFQVNSLDKDGNESNWFIEDNHGQEYLYIIRVFNAPEPYRFLIINASDASILGTTEPSTAEIFGDIDYDGKFEVGGMSMYCQGGDPKCHPEDHYRVFEIAPNFPTDITLTNYFKQFLREK